jgi:hypothetical protein
MIISRNVQKYCAVDRVYKHIGMWQSRTQSMRVRRLGTRHDSGETEWVIARQYTSK